MKSWTLDRVMEPVVLIINRVLIGNLERAFSIIGNSKQKKKACFTRLCFAKNLDYKFLF